MRTLQSTLQPLLTRRSSTYQSWDVIFTELENRAKCHNTFADKLENDLAKNILTYVKEKQKVKKKVLCHSVMTDLSKLETDGGRITKDMKTAVDNLQKVLISPLFRHLFQARAKYVQLSKEADAAEAVHTKGKGDMSMKPSQLAKVMCVPSRLLIVTASWQRRLLRLQIKPQPLIMNTKQY